MSDLLVCSRRLLLWYVGLVEAKIRGFAEQGNPIFKQFVELDQYASRLASHAPSEETLTILGFPEGYRCPFFGLYYDYEEFICVHFAAAPRSKGRSFPADVIEYGRAKYTDPGSKAMLQAVLKRSISPVLLALTDAVKTMGVVLKGPARKDDPSGYLGRGAFGAVFRATRDDGKEVAFKLAVGIGAVRAGTPERNLVYDETRRDAISELVVLPVAEHTGSVKCETAGLPLKELEYSCVLFTFIGTPVCKVNHSKCFSTLVSLHKAGYTHGDVRPQNFVMVGTSARLIDLCTMAIATPQRLDIDLRAFVDRFNVASPPSPTFYPTYVKTYKSSSLDELANSASTMFYMRASH